MFHRKPAGLHILHRAIAGDAFHDSAERYPQPQCHPDTRTKLLEVLSKWACGIEPPINWTSDDNVSTISEEDDNVSAISGEDDEKNNQPSSCILWLHGPAGSGKSAVAQSLCQKLKEEGRLGRLRSPPTALQGLFVYRSALCSMLNCRDLTRESRCQPSSLPAKFNSRKTRSLYSLSL